MWKNLLNLVVQFIVWFFKVPSKQEGGSIVYPTVTLPQPIKKVKLTSVMNIPNIVERFLPPNQYVNEVSEKTQIVLHHTVGGSAKGTMNYWADNKERVATHFIIDRDGTIYQCIPFENWGYHLWVNSPGNRIGRQYRKKGSEYDKHSFGIEICNYGPLTPKKNFFLNIYNDILKVAEKVKFKDYLYWEPYTDAQISSVKELVLYLSSKFNIPLKEDYSDIFDIFDINLDALNQVPGLYTHVSYRTDKSDCYPHSSFKEMLNSLKSPTKI